jgi:protein-S-isoprenylcysteine O-methyltransferase Ste14
MRMNKTKNEFLPSVLNVIAAIVVFLISFFVEIRISICPEVAKSLGIFIVFFGMALVLWSSMHIREAFLGVVEPRLDVLIKSGPYKFIRHPVYLGLTIALTGIPVAMRSYFGLIGVFILFLPSEIYRAKLEEKALKSKFGSIWEEYSA